MWSDNGGIQFAIEANDRSIGPIKLIGLATSNGFEYTRKHIMPTSVHIPKPLLEAVDHRAVLDGVDGGDALHLERL